MSRNRKRREPMPPGVAAIEPQTLRGTYERFMNGEYRAQLEEGRRRMREEGEAPVSPKRGQK